MGVSFKDFFERVCKSTGITTQTDLSKILGVNRSAITQAKLRDAIPDKWILAISRKYNITADWLELGKGQQYLPKPSSSVAAKYTSKAILKNLPETPLEYDQENLGIFSVPKVAARLCAGGGSMEIDSTAVAHYDFSRSWLAKMGNPNSMVFMDVVGDSMEPGILEGDMVLVDQANLNINAHGVFAVGVEDSLYLKRVQRKNQGISLVSDNKKYSPLLLQADELNNFRVLGKVVWLCRDCRFY